MLLNVPNIPEGVGCQEEGDGAEGDEEDEAQLRVQMIADIALELFRDTYYLFSIFLEEKKLHTRSCAESVDAAASVTKAEEERGRCWEA